MTDSDSGRKQESFLRRHSDQILGCAILGTSGVCVAGAIAHIDADSFDGWFGQLFPNLFTSAAIVLLIVVPIAVCIPAVLILARQMIEPPYLVFSMLRTIGFLGTTAYLYIRFGSVDDDPGAGNLAAVGTDITRLVTTDGSEKMLTSTFIYLPLAMVGAVVAAMAIPQQWRRRGWNAVLRGPVLTAVVVYGCYFSVDLWSRLFGAAAVTHLALTEIVAGFAFAVLMLLLIFYPAYTGYGLGNVHPLFPAVMAPVLTTAGTIWGMVGGFGIFDMTRSQELITGAIAIMASTALSAPEFLLTRRHLAVKLHTTRPWKHPPTTNLKTKKLWSFGYAGKWQRPPAKSPSNEAQT